MFNQNFTTEIQYGFAFVYYNKHEQAIDSFDVSNNDSYTIIESNNYTM